MYALINATLYTGESVLVEHAVIINGQKIAAVLPLTELPENIKTIDLKGQNLSPGFIDLQLNGCGGVMFNGAETEQTLATMQAANLKSGTTSYLPTFITAADQGMKQAIQAVRHYMQKTPNEVLGLHLEGPYINLEKKGIHQAQFVRSPEMAMIDFICSHAAYIRKVTLAPENTPVAIIKQLTEAGIVVSLGHSNSTYQQAHDAITYGASFATHLFNAMSPMTGREPGLVGAVYDHNLYAGIIVDGFHVAYENVRISKRLMGDKLILVTDATAAAGADIKQFDFVGTTVYYQQGRCVGADGTLGGSALTMIEAIKNCVQFVGITLDEALRMATLYPAQALSIDDRLGRIRDNNIANLTVFDHHYQVNATIVNGCYKERGR